jgi:hypothetical protein
MIAHKISSGFALHRRRALALAIALSMSGALVAAEAQAPSSKADASATAVQADGHAADAKPTKAEAPIPPIAVFGLLVPQLHHTIQTSAPRDDSGC